MITAGGENVAPVLIEDNIKAECPFVSQAMVIGDRRKFLSVFLTLKVIVFILFFIVSSWINLFLTHQTEVDSETQEPLPILTSAAQDWCRDIGGLSLAETVTDVISAVERGSQRLMPSGNSVSVQDTEALHFVQAIDQAIDRANRKAISGAQRVQKWTILPVDFSIPGGELGTLSMIYFFFESNVTF